MRAAIVLALALSSSIPAGAAKPPAGTTPNPQVAYVILAGPGYEIRVTNEDGTNSAILYKSKAPLRIDLAPRSQRQIVFTEGGSQLRLLTYEATTSGGFATTNIETLLTSTAFLNNPDFSPDGSKIAFGDEGDLKVYDLGTHTVETWTTTSYVWDVAWYKQGAAIVFVEPPNGGPTAKLYEISGPGATPTLIHTERDLNMIDSARTNPNALVFSYNDTAGNAYVGLWAAGGYISPNLAGRTPAYKGTLNCDDTKLMYGAPDQKGQTIWYSRNLTQNQDSLYTKTLRVNWTQFWPTCE